MDISKYFVQEGEKPLDKLVTDGGLCAIFRRIGCIGDSLSSGEFESCKGGQKTYHDMFEYSWGQVLARMSGSVVENFSRGGMTAKEYCEGYAEQMGYWAEEKKCNAYIIALGVNDFFGKHFPVGDLNDVDFNNYKNNNLDTFIGAYAQIIQRYKEISPKARFFFVSMPKESTDGKEAIEIKEKHLEVLNLLASKFEFCYVIDLYHYGPDYGTKEFRDLFYMYGHLSPAGYVFTAKELASYIDYIIKSNPKDFIQMGFCFSEFYDETLDKKA